VIAAAIVLVPFVAALLCALPPISRAARPIAVSAAVAVIALSGSALATGTSNGTRVIWAPQLGAGLAVDVDGLSALMLILVGVVFAIGAAAGARVPRRRAYFALWCLLLSLLAGVFVARDLLLFFIFWEALLVPLAVLLWQWGGDDRRGAATRLVVHNLAGSAPLLVAVVALAVTRGTLDIDVLGASRIASGGQLLPALLVLSAFAVRLPLFPLHAWMPRALAAAPVAVGLAIAGGLATTAAYGIVRVSLPLFPQGMTTAAPLLVALAAIGALYAALIATRQDDLRRLVAYASLSQLQLIALGAFAASATSVRGAVLATASHGVVIAALLLLAGMVALRTRSFAASRAGGLAASAPVLAMLFTLTVCAGIGLPGTSGFAGQLLALAGAYERFPAAAAAAAGVFIVAAVYGLVAVRRVFHGPPLVTAADLGWRERALVAPLLALVMVLGIAPTLLTDRIPSDALPAVEAPR
jgi:NADH-quinone oxidoreductase subunit M